MNNFFLISSSRDGATFAVKNLNTKVQRSKQAERTPKPKSLKKKEKKDTEKQVKEKEAESGLKILIRSLISIPGE